ncbi:DMT family transporter [Flammeovirga pectinis]|uniref:DMT family transporter n=1 Tax=Flammeovirga pectinis TaxID=2494373 RepID=A0A3Q9FQI0_9BACT|nr:DMT family transporter [Flammeovirga pectinis]AZQ65264.1 DMT family transporter [Flammeovirga pectinis]
MKIEHLLYISLALAAGALMPLQSNLNAKVGSTLGSPFLGTIINFMGGTLLTVFIILVLVRPQLPTKELLQQLPPYYYLGGILGVVFVTTSLFLVPRIGALNVFASIIAGQIVASLLFDHFGLMGVPVKPITLQKIIGVTLLGTGLLLILKDNN